MAKKNKEDQNKEKINAKEENHVEAKAGDSKQDDFQNDFENQVAELNDKYLRLYSEFDNFRKRTNRERIDLYKTAGKDIIEDLLGVIDDFERALDAKEEDAASIKGGMDLIYNKMAKTLNNHGLKAFKSTNEKFDPELHEAITKIPAPSKKLKGKVVDEIEKGYMLHDKVLRYSKVVVGE
jgi:molecular chaperone GrpE